METASISKCAIKVSLVIAIRATAGLSTVLGICSVLVTVAQKRLALCNDIYKAVDGRLQQRDCHGIDAV